MLTLETGLVLALVATAIATIVRLRPPRGGTPREVRVLRILAAELGLDPRHLALNASLVHDLGCTTADLIAVSAALELEFGIIIPEQRLREIRTCRDLVNTALALVEERDDDPPPFVSARLVPAATTDGDVRYTGWLTAATALSLAQEAFRAGPGSRLDVEVHEHPDDLALGWVAEQFSWLRELGIRVGIGAGMPAAGAPAV